MTLAERILSCSLAALALSCAGAPPKPSSPPAPSPVASAPAPATGGGAASSFAPLDLPEWVILPPGAPGDQPWILVIDDPQCPYCMQLHIALARARESGDPEIARAVLALLPFPLAFHDQAAHIVEDAFCLEASRGRGFSAAAYLDWLIVGPWRAEPGWSAMKVEDIDRDDGLFATRYDAHKVTSSRRRDYQTARARADAACGPAVCQGDAECADLCAAQKKCRDACPPGAGGPCATACGDRFVSGRYRQLSKVHSACLLDEGPASAHGKTAAAYAWAIAHKVPGTPTIYLGHPTIGFRRLDDYENLASLFPLLRSGLADARARMAAPRR